MPTTPRRGPHRTALLRVLLQLVKGVYDLLASYLLAWVLALSLLAWGFWAVATAIIVWGAGFETIEAFWAWIDRTGPAGSLTVRLAVFVLAHALAVIALRRHLWRIKARLERAADRLLARFRRWAVRHPRGRATSSAAFSALLTLLLVPFVLQPTLVPLGRLGGRAWLERAANLVDGSASAAIADSVVGLYRKLFAAPVGGYGVSAADFDRAQRGANGTAGPGGQPLMDRWDPLLWQTVGEDRRAFALLKALIWVESGGRRFAVSRTGCAGLTQFCARTASSGGFHRIFGVGQVYPCRCEGRCAVDRQVQRDLETGQPELIESHRDGFVCDVSDARFDPTKAIVAGHRYLQRLAREFAGNIYVIYVSYNSGPQVGRRLWSGIGGAPAAGLETIGPRLPLALSPYFGRQAQRRARSLLRTHLPKLRRAFETYYLDAAARQSPASARSSRCSNWRSRARSVASSSMRCCSQSSMLTCGAPDACRTAASGSIAKTTSVSWPRPSCVSRCAAPSVGAWPAARSRNERQPS